MYFINTDSENTMNEAITSVIQSNKTRACINYFYFDRRKQKSYSNIIPWENSNNIPWENSNNIPWENSNNIPWENSNIIPWPNSNIIPWPNSKSFHGQIISFHGKEMKVFFFYYEADILLSLTEVLCEDLNNLLVRSLLQQAMQSRRSGGRGEALVDGQETVFTATFRLFWKKNLVE